MGEDKDPLSLNLYTYCSSDPVNFLDPNGHRAMLSDLALGMTDSEIEEMEILNQEEEDILASGDTSDDAQQRISDIESRLWEVRNNYITSKQVKAAIYNLKYFGVIGDDNEYTAEYKENGCYSLTSSDLIYATAAMLRSDNYNKLLYYIGGGSSIQEEVNAFYGEVLCFTEDTLIYAKEGYKPIKDIKVGDEVYSENEETGEKGLKKVTNVFINESDVLIHVYAGDEEIKATPTHPFWVKDKAWIKAGDLNIGDKLVLYSGEIVEVTSVETEKLDTPIKVYNFEVQDWHTYFVSNNNVLVHNKCDTSYYTQTGYYEIVFESGYRYIGKGSAFRMNYSANKHSIDNNNDKIISMTHTPTSTVRDAFKGEALLQIKYGFNQAWGKLYNKIWSPGKKYLEQDEE